MSKTDGANVDREKLSFIELANRGRGLTPINYTYSKDISSDNIKTTRLTSAYADIRNIENDTIESDTSAQIANIEIYKNTIQTFDDEGHLDIKIGMGNGNINLSTYNYSTSMLSKGNITFTTYGAGNIYLTPTLSGPDPIPQIGSVYINTLLFSLDPDLGSNTVDSPEDLIFNSSGNFIVYAAENDKNIILSTYSLGAEVVPAGDIDLITYGTGNINLTPTLSGPSEEQKIGSVFINTLQFSLDSETDTNTITVPHDLYVKATDEDSNIITSAVTY